MSVIKKYLYVIMLWVLWLCKSEKFDGVVWEMGSVMGMGMEKGSARIPSEWQSFSFAKPLKENSNTYHSCVKFAWPDGLGLDSVNRSTHTKHKNINGLGVKFKMIVFSPRKLTFSTKPHTFLLSWMALIVFIYSHGRRGVSTQGGLMRLWVVWIHQVKPSQCRPYVFFCYLFLHELPCLFPV